MNTTNTAKVITESLDAKRQFISLLSILFTSKLSSAAPLVNDAVDDHGREDHG